MNPSLPSPEDTSGLRHDVLDWFTRRQRDGWSADEEAAFQAWLAADASRSAAYAQWASHWQALGSVPADTLALLRSNLARDKAADQVRQAIEAQTRSQQSLRHRPAVASAPRRRFFMPAFATAAAVVLTGSTALLGWSYWQAQPVFAQSFNTPRGQQIEVQLPDGSRLRLDTATRLDVTYYRQRREVKLLDGQAVFSVQADAAKPFHVLAGPVGVTVVGTRFSVRYTPALPDDQGVRVLVEEGKVRVAPLAATAGDLPQEVKDEVPGSIYLTAGEQVQANAQGRLAAVMPLQSGGMAPWRDNRVSFVDTPLSQALAELERYGSTGLTVRDPAVAALRLSGTFDPRDARTLQRVLPAALPVRLQPSGASIEILPAR